MSFRSMARRLGKIAIVSVLSVALAGCSSLSEIKTAVLRPLPESTPISTDFLKASFFPSPYDTAAVVSDMCVSKTAPPSNIQANIDAKDGCAAMTDRPYGGNPRALFQRVDAGGTVALRWKTDQLVHFTGMTSSQSASDWVIPDTALRNAILEVLGRPHGAALAYSDAGSVSGLNLPAEVKSLEGLQYAGKLDHLDISLTDVTDLSPLKDLPLRGLSVNGAHIIDWSPVAYLPNVAGRPS